MRRVLIRELAFEGQKRRLRANSQRERFARTVSELASRVHYLPDLSLGGLFNTEHKHERD